MISTSTLDTLEALANNAPAGKWEIHTSNSWRRVYADQGREKVLVIEPYMHKRWPDLVFGPGVEAWIEGFTPDVARELIAEVRALRERRDGPGTPSARMTYLHAELDKRFPDAVNPVLSDPPEPKYLAAIDALKEDAERYRWAISLEDNAESLYAAVMNNAPSIEEIGSEIDAYRTGEKA